MSPHPGEKLLAAEMIACLTLEWVATIYRNRNHLAADPLGAAPKPQVILPAVMAFSALGLLALFGPQPARLAAGVGGLVTLVVVLKTSQVIFTGPKLAPALSTSTKKAMIV